MKSALQAQNDSADQRAGLQPTGTSIDPALAALFAASSGPVEIPIKTSRTVSRHSAKSDIKPVNDVGEDEQISPESATPPGTSSEGPPGPEADNERPRKRRRVEADDLEAKYFSRIAREEDRDAHQRIEKEGTKDDDTSSSGSDTSDEDSNTDISEHLEPIPRHETLDKSDETVGAEKANRTVFLGNVSITAIQSKSSRKTLINHLESVLDSKKDNQTPTKVESLRFRSTAYASGVGPKKAAYAKKELMDQTMKSTNAYAVFTTEWAAKKAVAKLNGTVVLDRHLRVDLVAYPSKIDHHRCVFVGNLSFVDEEIIEEKGADGEVTLRKSRAKQPADAEEGLWRTFAKAGKVESVRVVRDKESRVGKGFGYVQFADQNGVEAALLLNDKKFPPLLPRKLRVMRAKKIREPRSGGTDPRRAAKRQSRHGEQAKRRTNGYRGSEDIKKLSKAAKFIFEGHRASGSTQAKDMKSKKKRPIVKPNTRSSRRGAAFKAAGGKRKR